MSRKQRISLVGKPLATPTIFGAIQKCLRCGRTGAAYYTTDTLKIIHVYERCRQTQTPAPRYHALDQCVIPRVVDVATHATRTTVQEPVGEERT